jgi:hypothetical protein
MAKPASASPSNVTITKHSMIASVLRHKDGGRQVPIMAPPVVIVLPTAQQPKR